MRSWLLRHNPLTMTLSWVSAALAPDWRWSLLIAGQCLLYAAITVVAPGQGRLTAAQSVVGVVSGLCAFAALFAATRRAPHPALVALWERLPAIARWPGWRAALSLVMLYLMWTSLVWQIPDAVRGYYHEDAIAYVHMDADLLRQGVNPYTANDAFWVASRRWPAAFATPILNSRRFGGDPLNYPTQDAQGATLTNEVRNPALRNDGFDPQTVHNYPAGIIWLALPLVWAGAPSIIALNMLCYLALIIMILARLRPADRPGALMALVTNPVMLLYTLFVNFEVVALVFVLAAWMARRHGVWSGLALGFACSVKQLAWFFVPFYFIEIWRREGRATALRRLPWLVAGFLVPNLPFILLSPASWLHSLLIPLTDPMFPLGFGLVALALGGVIPLWPKVVFTALEMAVWLGLMVWQWRRRAPNSDGVLISPLPLWLAWRSPMSYFAFTPALAVWLAGEESRLAALAPEVAPLPAPELELELDATPELAITV